MKEELSIKTRLIATTMLLVTVFAATSCAGPGLQCWMRNSTPGTPGATAHHTTTTPEANPPAACTGCTVTPVRVYTDRGPAGKSVVVSKVVGTKHQCTFCNAAVAAAGTTGTETTPMHAAKCAEMRCCVMASK